MNKKTCIIPLALILLLAGCNTSSNKGNNKKSSSSVAPAPSEQSVPSYDGIPDYGPYSGTPGVAPNHIQSMAISPNKEIYARVGDIIPIDGSVTAGYNDEEKIIDFSVDKATHLSVTRKDNKQDATLKCLAVGDATLTATSYQSRFKRYLLVHILPNDENYDLYETALSIDKERQKFGYGNTSYMTNGVSNGVSQFGHQTWKWHREKPGKISSYSGAIAFGTNDSPEGEWDFTTQFVKPVKSVTLGIASSRGSEQIDDYSFGSVKLTASIGGSELSRIVGGKTYAPGEECKTLKGSDDNTVSPHKIVCNDQSGDFRFHLTESAGYIRLKYIVVEYASYTPSGTLSEVNYSFDDESFTSLLTDTFSKKTVSDSASSIDVVLSSVKLGDETTSDHPMIKRNSTIQITPKNANQTIVGVELETSPFIYEERTIENIVEVTESNLGTSQMREYGVQRDETISLKRLSYGCNVVELKAATEQITVKEKTEEEPAEKIDVCIGIKSLKVVLTDAIAPAVVDEVYMFGKADKMDYAGGDHFDPTGAAIVVSFTDVNYQPIQINDLVTWPELTAGDTQTTGTSSYGDCLVTGITTGEYVNKTWVKATAGKVGNYLAVSRDSHTLFDASSSTSEMQSGSSNRDISSYFVGEEIHGDYGLDHSYIVTLAATSGNFKVMNASKSHYFNGISSSTGKLSFSTSSNRNHSLDVVDGELRLSFVSSNVTYTFCLAKSAKDESIFFSFVDMASNPELVIEHVDFYVVS